jgi:NADH:ubiquinone oxidoreductase subunit F (NADH-binding)
VVTFFARETCPVCVTGTARLAQLLRPGADRALAAAERTEITDVAAQHRHMGICTLLDTAASIALTSAPQLVSSLQEPTPAPECESQHGHARMTVSWARQQNRSA